MASFKEVDKDEAPLGYYAAPKNDVRPSENLLSPNRNENVCRLCDWRPHCNKSHPCMSYDRADGFSVVFKNVIK